jgi:hypothetical protein
VTAQLAGAATKVQDDRCCLKSRFTRVQQTAYSSISNATCQYSANDNTVTVPVTSLSWELLMFTWQLLFVLFAQHSICLKPNCTNTCPGWRYLIPPAQSGDQRRLYLTLQAGKIHKSNFSGNNSCTRGGAYSPRVQCMKQHMR